MAEGDSSRKVWLDSSGRVLIDTSSNVYYASTCCCVPPVSECWQYYTARCTQVYDSSSAWDSPTMVQYTCVPRGSFSRTDINTWYRESDFAYLWTSIGTCGDVSCDTPVHVDTPYFPCSCETSAWNGSVALPSIWLRAAVIVCRGWNFLRDIEHNITGSVLVVSTRFWEWDVTKFDYDRYEMADCSRVGVSFVQFICNYDTAGAVMASSHCPSSGPEYDSWYASQYHPAVYAEVFRLNCYYRTAYASLAADAPLSLWLPIAESNGQGFIRNGNTTIVTSVALSNILAENGQYVHSPYFTSEIVTSFTQDKRDVNKKYEFGTVSFNGSQWGNVYRRYSATDSHVHMQYARHCEGALAPPQSIPIQHGAIPDTLYACPYWRYVFFIYTDFDIASLNSACVSDALKGTTSAYNYEGGFNVVLENCVSYYFVVFTEFFGQCMSDQPSGALCQPMGYSENVYSADINRLYPYRATNYSSYAWWHEIDDAFTPGQPYTYGYMRGFNSSKDAHRYQVITLNIDNFPSWYSGALCSGTVNPADWEVPHIDITDEHWFCYMRPSSCSNTPVSIAYPYVSSSCCYYAHSEVTSVAPVSFGVAAGPSEYYLCTALPPASISSDAASSIAYAIYKPANISLSFASTYCPNVVFVPYVFRISEVTDICSFSSNGVPVVRSTVHTECAVDTLGVLSFSSGGNSMPVSLYSATWQGHAPNFTALYSGAVAPEDMSNYSYTLSGYYASGTTKIETILSQGIYICQSYSSYCVDPSFCKLAASYDYQGSICEANIANRLCGKSSRDLARAQDWWAVPGSRIASFTLDSNMAVTFISSGTIESYITLYGTTHWASIKRTAMAVLSRYRDYIGIPAGGHCVENGNTEWDTANIPNNATAYQVQSEYVSQFATLTGERWDYTSITWSVKTQDDPEEYATHTLTGYVGFTSNFVYRYEDDRSADNATAVSDITWRLWPYALTANRLDGYDLHPDSPAFDLASSTIDMYRQRHITSIWVTSQGSSNYSFVTDVTNDVTNPDYNPAMFYIPWASPQITRLRDPFTTYHWTFDGQDVGSWGHYWATSGGDADGKFPTLRTCWGDINDTGVRTDTSNYNGTGGFTRVWKTQLIGTAAVALSMHMA